MYFDKKTFSENAMLNVSTTPIRAMGCQQCSPLSVVQLKGKHCRNGVVDTFEQRVAMNLLSNFYTVPVALML